MKTLLALSLFFLSVANANGQYLNNRAPLRPNPYMELPPQAIQPQGWLKEMLVRQKDGATGQLDQLYPLVMGPRNGWLGGDGDQWERGPYWLDGLVPLAYILNDKALIAKIKPWIEWSLNSQQADGYFGPARDYGPEDGIQRDNSHDWWPKMVMLKVLQQYYEATHDQRVITLLTKYFRYQLKELPAKPLDHWTFWARYRAGDNLMVVYWLYNITGDTFLLQLGDLLHQQAFDFTKAFAQGKMLTTMGSVHGVNLAQGMKEPLIYYQHHPESQYIDAINKGFNDLRTFNGFANGMFGGDESLHGGNPTQGAELCTVVEMMFTLEQILSITGNVKYADHLERIAFNALPTQVTEDFTARQYFQQANQVMVTRHFRNFDINHHGTDICYGLLTGYACCTSNMHQGWPKFTRNLWYATPDKGLAALVYSPCEVTALVAGNKQVHIKEETNYPFAETIKFRFTTAGNKATAFPLQLRIPEWCDSGAVTINGIPQLSAKGGQVVTIRHEWKTGDVAELRLPMKLSTNRWYENAASVERGPLVYALKIGEQTKRINNDKDAKDYGSTYQEIIPTTPWNYGLVSTRQKDYTVEEKGTLAVYPWNADQAPILIKTKARRIPSWQLYNEMAGPIPYSPIYQMELGKEEEISLIPYGCTKLRISEFPVTGGE
ncbi:beta-L-arabinofuranosidase domain-containing protein [Chitinophaga vietnamensis]|uniref:beta-L-arabinofuranosidase domain-containing protein n=1 Tax=Chitinophaga vietnamensis TaxID=2593957 RepID=UPI001177ADF0|nr:beta-L-arabinofuranosidase domain-containing protein [Chitinophaga vietnamensis]